MNTNYKIEKITYEEYLSFKEQCKYSMDKEAFDNYNNMSKLGHNFYKIRIDFEYIYFDVTSKELVFINRDIYKYGTSVIMEIFKNIASLSINKSIAFYTPFYGTRKGYFEDYVDNFETKEKFINDNEKFFDKKIYDCVYKIDCNEKAINNYTIEKTKSFYYKVKNINDNMSFYINYINDTEIVIIDMDYENIYKSKKGITYFNFMEDAIKYLNQKFNKVYVFAPYEFETSKYFKSIKYNYFKTIYQYKKIY